MSLHHQGPMKLCFQRECKNKPGEKPYLTSCNGSGGRVVHAAVVGCNIYFSLQEKDPTAILVDTWMVGVFTLTPKIEICLGYAVQLPDIFLTNFFHTF